MSALDEYKAAKKEMQDDTQDDWSPGWYGWITADIVEKMAKELESQRKEIAILRRGIREIDLADSFGDFTERFLEAAERGEYLGPDG